MPRMGGDGRGCCSECGFHDPKIMIPGSQEKYIRSAPFPSHTWFECKVGGLPRVKAGVWKRIYNPKAGSLSAVWLWAIYSLLKEKDTSSQGSSGVCVCACPEPVELTAQLRSFQSAEMVLLKWKALWSPTLQKAPPE